MGVEDVRRRRVPRAWIAVGCALQLLANLVWGALDNTFFTLIQSVLFALLCALVQGVLALLKPGSLGLGDVTATLMVGLAVGAYGLGPVVVWWLMMGVLGLAFIALWTRFDPQRRTAYRGKVPFAPVIVAAGVIAVFASPLFA